MKPVYIIGVLVILGVLGYWMAFRSNDTEQAAVNIPLAFGKPSGGQVDMHVVVGVALANVTRARDSMSGKDKDWNGWIRDHCHLKDAAGKPVSFTRQSGSTVVKAHEVAQVVGTEEFFMVATLKVGQTYTFDYVGDLATGKTYRCEFTAPSKAEKVQTYRFDPLMARR
jgi:hypothetical protein